MADWLELTNTFINLRTMEGVNQLAQAQQQLNAAMLNIEFQKQRDNQLLSKLVDMAVKVSEFVQDGRSLDALLTAALGLMSYKQVYPNIINAEIKMKAAEIRFKLSDVIKGILSNDQTNDKAHEELSTFLMETLRTIKSAIDEIDIRATKQEYHLVVLDPKFDWDIQTGEECVPLADIYSTERGLLLHKGRSYNVTRIDAQNKHGFYVSNELGGETMFNPDKSRAALDLAFIEPALPQIERDISGWQLCNSVFSNEFLDQHLKAVYQKMSALYDKSLHRNEECVNLPSMIDSYHSKRQETIRVAMLPSEKKTEQKTIKQEKRILTVVYIVLTIFVLIVAIVAISRMTDETPKKVEEIRPTPALPNPEVLTPIPRKISRHTHQSVAPKRKVVVDEAVFGDLSYGMTLDDIKKFPAFRSAHQVYGDQGVPGRILCPKSIWGQEATVVFELSAEEQALNAVGVRFRQCEHVRVGRDSVRLPGDCEDVLVVLERYFDTTYGRFVHTDRQTQNRVNDPAIMWVSSTSKIFYELNKEVDQRRGAHVEADRSLLLTFQPREVAGRNVP